VALLGPKELRMVADTAHGPLEAMGQTGARLLSKLVREKDVIGFSWSNAVAAMVGQLTPAVQPELRCIPLVGIGSPSLNGRYGRRRGRVARPEPAGVEMASNAGGTSERCPALRGHNRHPARKIVKRQPNGLKYRYFHKK